MKERRKNDEGIVTTLAVIQEKVSTIEVTVQEIREEERANSDKLIQLNGLRGQISGHAKLDLWLFGIVFTGITVIIGIMVK